MLSLLLIFLLSSVAGVTSSPLSESRLDSVRALYAEAYRLDLGSDSVTPDTVAANRLYLQAAELGYSPAQNMIGYRLMKGEGITPDADKGLYWLEQAADNNDVRAASNLGYLLANGYFVKQDDDKALYWLNRAAEHNFAPAMSQLGDFFRDGRSVQPDTLQAANLYAAAAESGLPDAASKLIALSGVHRLDFSEVKTPDDYQIISSSLPEVFIDNPSFLSLIARFYALGYGVPYNYEKSLGIYRLAAEAGDDEAFEILEELRGQFPDHPVLDGLRSPSGDL